MDVSICIVNWNTRELLRRCLDSIGQLTDGLEYEVVVVDNCSGDGSADMVRQDFPGCRLLASPVNLGFVKGNNLAVKKTTGRYILYLNPDTELVTNAILGMFRFLESRPEYGAAGCRLINPDGTIQYTCASTFPTPFRELCHYLCLNRIFKGDSRFSARELDHWDHRDSRSVDCLSGACMLVRRGLVERLGGFDERIFMYSEDLDLCYRIRQEGTLIYYLADEVIIHREGASTARKNHSFALLMQKQSNCYFLAKHFGRVKAAQYRLATACGAAGRIAATVLLAPMVALWARRHGKNYDTLFRKPLILLLWAFGLLRPRPPEREDYNYAS